MRKSIVVVFAIVASIMVSSSAIAQDKVLSISTTTSTQASGLLDILLPEFKKDTGIDVKVIAKGTGAAMRDGMDGNVDLIFVHAKAREEKFVAEGYGTQRYAVMHNDFIIIGPEDDPANVAKTDDVRQGLKAIAASQALFISRGDDSGTHTKEQALWTQSGVEVEEQKKAIVKKGTKVDVVFTEPANADSWYRSIGQGMGKTLTFADEKKAYTMTDRGTYIKYKYGKSPALELTIVSEGSPELANPYGVIPVNPEKYPEVKHDLAVAFADWVVSEKGQKLIGDYRLIGKQLFYPDAIAQ